MDDYKLGPCPVCGSNLIKVMPWKIRPLTDGKIGFDVGTCSQCVCVIIMTLDIPHGNPYELPF